MRRHNGISSHNRYFPKIFVATIAVYYVSINLTANNNGNISFFPVFAAAVDDGDVTSSLSTSSSSSSSSTIANRQQQQEVEIRTDGSSSASSTSTLSSSSSKSNTSNTKRKTDGTLKIAIATLVTTSLYVPGAEVLAQSLLSVHNTNTTYPYDLVLLHLAPGQDSRSDVSPQNLADLEYAGWKLHPLSTQDGTYNGIGCPIQPYAKELMLADPNVRTMERYWGTCAKLSLWSLTDYHIVFYIDADGIALNAFVNPLVDWFILQQEHRRKKGRNGAATLGAQLAPGDPDNPDAEYQTAFLVLQPSTGLHGHLQKVLSQHSNVPQGELPLLNNIFGAPKYRDKKRGDVEYFAPLPEWTSVAQTNIFRPFIDVALDEEQEDEHYQRTTTTTTKKKKQVVDWNQVSTYDFAGPPNCKPWITYALHKKTGDIYRHSLLGKVPKGSDIEEIYMVPQWKWNEYYDAILRRKEERDLKEGNENLQQQQQQQVEDR